MQEEKYYRTKDISEVIMEQLGDQIREIMKEDIMQDSILKMKQYGLIPSTIAEIFEVPLEKVLHILEEPND